MSEGTYKVDIQPYVDGKFADQHFTVTVDAEGLAQAERRGIRRAVARADEWNAEHPLATVPRRTNKEAYRAIRAYRASKFPTVTAPVAPIKVLVDFTPVINALTGQKA